ncbi:uncharacterized protein LOC141913965 [Tubulanus polymorphus]|uniref:uncharacterized protein LOC141913965 n=1 Tax=Tubulanus polymorphus TaxID=672921 RepID=UPI003DA3B64E
MTNDMIDAITYLTQTNQNKLNPYLFARQSPLSRTPLDGCEAFRVITSLCPNLQNATSIRSSALRRYLATTSQILDMKSEELKMLCDHMGHDANIHINHYRLQSSIIEKSKVARLLIAIENGQLKSFRGKTLDEIQIDSLPMPLQYSDRWSAPDDSSDGEPSAKLAKTMHSNPLPGCSNAATSELVEPNFVEADSSIQRFKRSKQSSEIGSKTAMPEFDEPNLVEADSSVSPAKASGPPKEKLSSKIGVVRRRWSEEENRLFFTRLRHYVDEKKMPPSSELQKLVLELKNQRTLAQIRSRVHNYISGKQKM